MSDRLGLFAQPIHPVLSLNVQAATLAARREQSEFEVLVRHLLYRFFHNELLASDDETKRVMQISYAVALPGLLLALFLFPAYHGFPPYPLLRPFWEQVGDHYFYVMYSLVVLGAATVYEWDLLFPDLLDVFVLSTLPIPERRLFLARVLALGIFLALVLLGTSGLGTIFLPMVAELPGIGRHLLAHSVAVIMSGTFAAATFLSLQGFLINTIGQALFRKITPILQGGSLMLLLAVLLLYPTLSHSLQPLLTTGNIAVRWFPPFWFLGIYERILIGPTAPRIFRELAQTACLGLLVMLTCVLITYPLAYRRRVRQLIEGAVASTKPAATAAPFLRILHRTILRSPDSRATFHFASQTVLRSQRHRVMLAMYGGLAIALALANMLVFHISGRHVQPEFLPEGVRAAIPIMAFWTVVGLRSIVSAPVDRRGAWIFHVLVGQPKLNHLAGIRIWIALWTCVVCLTTALTLHVFSPAALKMPIRTAAQLLIASGLSLLLSDILLFTMRSFPYTHLRRSSITDFPLMIFRYVVLFPIFVAIVLHYEPAIEFSVLHLLETLLCLAGAHLLMQSLNEKYFQHSSHDRATDEDEFPQKLGLRDT